MNNNLARTLLVYLFCIVLQGCAALERLPRQHVLVSTPATPVGSGVLVSGCRSADGTQWSCLPIQGEGGVLPVQRARPFTPPAIATNGEIYVVAWWAAPPGFNSLQLAVSEDGNQWSFTNLLGVFAASSDVNERSRLSLTYHTGRRTWFVAFQSANTDTVWIGELDVACMPDARGDCAVDSRGVTRYGVTVVVATRDTGISVVRSPTLATFENALLLAGRDPDGSGDVLMFSSSAGTAFTPITPIGATSGTLTSQSTPYLNNSLGSLFLLTTRLSPVGSERIELWTSTDTATWTLRRTTAAIGAELLGPYDVAASGPENEMVIAHPTPGRATTTVLAQGRSTSLSTGTHAAVGLAHGP